MRFMHFYGGFAAAMHWECCLATASGVAEWDHQQLDRPTTQSRQGIYYWL